ncbi:BRO family protein [Liquorilactobacillus mali]
MKKELQMNFSFEGNKVRTVQINNEPYFVGKDVAEILGYSNTRDALLKHVDIEDKGVANCDTLGGMQKLTAINESGLYSLIISSKLPSAKKFKHWVTSEVLPSIRNHGVYMTPETLQETLAKPENMIQILTALKDEQEARQIAETKVITLNTRIKKQAPKVAYHDQILKTQGVTYTATQIAKEYGTSASKLNNLLHELKFIYKSNGQWVLYSKFQSAGLTQSETVERNGRVFDSTRWTERGRKAMFYLLTKKGFVDEDNKIDWVKVKEIREENYKKIMGDTIMDSEELDNNMAILK